jgi:hypothetical protein
MEYGMEELEISFWISGDNRSKEWVWASIFENFRRKQSYSLVLIFNVKCSEVSRNKKQVFHYKLIHILWIEIYIKIKRTKQSKIMNAHKTYCILPVILLTFQRVWKLINQHTDHSYLFLREFLPNTTKHPLSPVFLFQNLYLLSEIHFPNSIENIHVC